MQLFQLKPVVNNIDSWNIFIKYIDWQIDEAHKQLENVTKLEEIYRGQGYIRCLKQLKSLRDTVNAKQT